MFSKILMLLIAFILIAFSFSKPVLTAGNQKRRITDLLVVGLIINFVPYFTANKGYIFTLQMIGGLIFFYGFSLVIIQKFIEGYTD
ncbi:MAG: hypothetical protein CVU89_02630 [Firmicutes bacterium HGW-Firmicutes-14]|nr:MAG: hypothetical protein CVU89_02630 [Firmicutes bacterium HGW-Firmicutes-14]